MRGSTWKLLGLLGMVTAAPADAEVRIGLASALTGTLAWAGGLAVDGAEIAIADLNAKSGILGQPIEMITADDFCEGEQAVAAAKKLIAYDVVVVFGHPCSGAAIPASKVYADAAILMISNSATNPKLTEQGFTNVFRMVGRDDLQGRMAGDLLAERWGNKSIAILHDGRAYGRGLAKEAKKRLNERGIVEAMFKAIEPGKADYLSVVQAMRAMGVKVLYFGGYTHDAGLIIRQAKGSGYELQLVGGDGIAGEDFPLIAGAASNGTLITRLPDPSANPRAAALMPRFERPDSRFGFTTYAAVQVWAQAVEIAATFETEAVAEVLRSHEFETVLGTIGFDEKGDVTGYNTFVWYVWKGGKLVAADPAKLTE